MGRGRALAREITGLVAMVAAGGLVVAVAITLAVAGNWTLAGMLAGAALLASVGRALAVYDPERVAARRARRANGFAGWASPPPSG